MYNAIHPTPPHPTPPYPTPPHPTSPLPYDIYCHLLPYFSQEGKNIVMFDAMFLVQFVCPNVLTYIIIHYNLI